MRNRAIDDRNFIVSNNSHSSARTTGMILKYRTAFQSQKIPAVDGTARPGSSIVMQCAVDNCQISV
jgi:hypothetical protein